MTAETPLTDAEYAYLKRNGFTGRALDEVVSAVESILKARETALRETIAQEIEAYEPMPNEDDQHEWYGSEWFAGKEEAARIVRGQA